MQEALARPNLVTFKEKSQISLDRFFGGQQGQGQRAAV